MIIIRLRVVVRAFVFVKVRAGSEMEVLGKLRKFPEVKESYFVYGLYDLVAVVETDSMEHLKDAVTWKIRRLGSVISTITSMIAETK